MKTPFLSAYKASYALRQNLGGVMIWELSGDTRDAELLSSTYRALHHPLPARTFTRAAATPKLSSLVAQGAGVAGNASSESQ